MGESTKNLIQATKYSVYKVDKFDVIFVCVGMKENYLTFNSHSFSYSLFGLQMIAAQAYTRRFCEAL